MSFTLKAVILVTTFSLGALASQVLPTAAGRKAEQPSAAADDSHTPPADRPRARSNPRNPDVPLQHAILHDEKDDDSPEAIIFRTLDKPTTVEFTDKPLEDCLAFLRELHHIPIWLDRGPLAEEGVALDQPITLKLADVRLESALNLLLEPLQLDWIIQDEVMKITTRTWAREHPEVRSYDVQNLIDAGHKSEDLIASIKACIDPLTWNEQTCAGISHTGGVLVIRQSQRNHGEIARLLAELDDIVIRREEDGPADRGKEPVVSVEPDRPIGAAHDA